MIIKDILGNILEEGDVVFRAKHSNFVIHRIIKITRRALVLSCQKNSRQSTRYITIYDIGRTRYRTEARPYTYKWVVDTYTVDSLLQHNDKIYVSLPWSTRTVSQEQAETHEVTLQGLIKIQTLTI